MYISLWCLMMIANHEMVRVAAAVVLQSSSFFYMYKALYQYLQYRMCMILYTILLWHVNHEIQNDIFDLIYEVCTINVRSLSFLPDFLDVSDECASSTSSDAKNQNSWTVISHAYYCKNL